MMDAVVEEGAPAAAPPKPMTRLKLEDGLITPRPPPPPRMLRRGLSANADDNSTTSAGGYWWDDGTTAASPAIAGGGIFAAGPSATYPIEEEGEMEEEEAAAAPGANILQPLLTWLSKPQAWFDPAFEEDTSPLTEAEQVVHDSSERLGEVLRGRTLALCFNSWRVYLATSCFLREEEAEKAALVISLWRATTSGLLDARPRHRRLYRRVLWRGLRVYLASIRMMMRRRTIRVGRVCVCRVTGEVCGLCGTRMLNARRSLFERQIVILTLNTTSHSFDYILLYGRFFCLPFALSDSSSFSTLAKAASIPPPPSPPLPSRGDGGIAASSSISSSSLRTLRSKELRCLPPNLHLLHHS